MPRFFLITFAMFLFCAPSWIQMSAQEDDVPLGDVAREFRHSRPPDQADIIDNDNFSLMMDKAESERLDGQPFFAISRSGRTFTAVSPDGTCSLSFVASYANRTPAAYIASDLPQDELLKLEGPASIEDGSLAVSVHNGTPWEVKEIVVGVTVLQTQSSAEYRPATMGPLPVNPEKLPDLTMLYHLKGSSAPGATTVFQAPLGGNFGESKDWHWAIVGARGIPPAAPPSAVPQSLTTPFDSLTAVPLAPQIPADSAVNTTATPASAPSPATVPPLATAPPAENPQ
ncbi:MAG: hypothetical protein ACRD3P_05680 [Terriglobales bacterium]